MSILSGLVASAAVWLLTSPWQQVNADFVTLASLEREVAKSPALVADFYRKVLKTAEQAGASPDEQVGLKLVADFLGEKKLPVEEKLRAAEKALQVLTWHHETTSAAGQSSNLRRPLDEKLLEVRLQQLHELTAQGMNAGDWGRALAQAERLLGLYPTNLGVGKQIRRLWADYSANEKDLGKIRQIWLRCQELFLDAPELRRTQEVLQKRAQALLDESARLDDGPAREKLAEALALWPRLPGLRDALLRRQQKYSVLYVGVRHLPEFLSPATAWTDSEKRALDLLFESLVQPEEQTATGQWHQPQLAGSLPDPQPLKRRFVLRRDAYWSDGERVIPADVRHTAQMMTDARLPGRVSAWLNFFEPPTVEGTSFGLDFSLKQGMFEPLSLLGFKILPQSFAGKPLNRGDDPEFARTPVGSGPFVYAGRRQIDGRPFAVFLANPNYVRGDRPNEPHVREIRMFAWKDLKDLALPVASSALLLDVSSDMVPALKKRGLHQVVTLPQRRVHFLAFNHRVPVLTNDSLRRAVALAIDREAILNQCFRGATVDVERLGPVGTISLPLLTVPQGNAGFHRISNGPYPAGSWESAPGIPRDLFNPSLARARFSEARLDGKIKLSLKFPDDDPQVARACRVAARQIEKAAAAAGISFQLVLVAMPPRALKQALDRRDYEMAYCHWDFETDWLWPLFDPQPAAVQPGGNNFLGYDNDAPLQNLFRSTLSLRQFTALQKATHNLHAYLVQDKMPIVPLWQLDAHLAVPAGLTTGPIDPLRIFAHVSRWKQTSESERQK